MFPDISCPPFIPPSSPSPPLRRILPLILAPSSPPGGGAASVSGIRRYRSRARRATGGRGVGQVGVMSGNGIVFF